MIQPAPKTVHTCVLTPPQCERLEAVLRAHDFIPFEVQYAKLAGQKERVNVVLYGKGKLVVQGKGTQEFVEFILEPEVLQEARMGYEEVLNPHLLSPRIGVDESGKGDFFGPLCIAGVYVNEQVIKAWKNSGVRDSKNVGSDRKIFELAELIRTTPGCVHTVVPIGNEAYNRLHRQLGSVNSILAWGHARVIENLMLLRYQMHPPPVRAISDQFAATKETINKALMSLGREIELVQRHKAESDLAVAAASILARNEFLNRLSRLSKQYNLAFPKGASKEVEAVACEFLSKNGTETLQKVAKMHFRTAYRVQGLPEPPVKIWRKSPPH